MKVSFHVSDFDECFNSDKFRQLILSNWTETGIKGMALDPAWPQYKSMAEAGLLRIYVAKDEANEIVGYSVYFVTEHLHYKTVKHALSDMIYIRPTRRGFGKNFIAWIDEQLKNEGVVAVYRHATMKNNFRVLLERMGYAAQETLYIKRLDQWESKQHSQSPP
jgi:GNAT superfamily N-acetyltransferase